MMRALLPGGLSVLVLAVGCSEPGGAERPAELRAPLSTRIFASEPVSFEGPIYDVPPSGTFASAASSDGSYLLVMNRGSDSADYLAQVALVFHGSTPTDPGGTRLLLSRHTPAQVAKLAASVGNHWLILSDDQLVVLNGDGALKGTIALPFGSAYIVSGGDRALVVGDTQALLVDERGGMLGQPFNLAPPSMVNLGGAEFDGSNFLVEYATLDGVIAFAVSPAGVVGPPVTVVTAPTDPDWSGFARGVKSDRHQFLVMYDNMTGDWLRWRTAEVDDSQQVTLGAELFATGVNRNAPHVVFFGDRYVSLSTLNNQASFFNRDGSPQGGVFYWQPWPFQTSLYGILPAPDGSSALGVEYGGWVSQLGTDLALLDQPALQVGFGPDTTRDASIAFDGTNFSILWADKGRAAVRGVTVDPDGAIVGSGPTEVSVPASRQVLASNGSSILRVISATHSAVLTNADGTTVNVDLSGMAWNQGYPQVATSGDEYAIFDFDTAARVSATTGAVLGAGPLPTYLPPGSNVVFDGERYLIPRSSPAPESGVVSTAVISFSVDLTESTETLFWPVGSKFGGNYSIASNGDQVLLGWNFNSDEDGLTHSYVARLSHELEMLDDAPLSLGSSINGSNAPELAWDGTNFWVHWYDHWREEFNYVQVLRPQPSQGGFLLAEPATICCVGVIAGRPGGGLLLVTSANDGTVQRMLLDSRELKTGLSLDGQARFWSNPDRRRLPAELGRIPR